MRALDPFFFQGGDPNSDAFLWFSFLDTPSNSLRTGEPDTFECQVMIGWPHRKGFMGIDKPLDVPPEEKERLALMKRIAHGWTEPFRECVMRVPEGTVVQAVRLEDFVPRHGMWDNKHGRVTMVGDAVHAMTMCRFYSLSFLHCLFDCSLVSRALPLSLDNLQSQLLIRPSQRRRRKSRHKGRLGPSLQNSANS